jgi:hypothetical protein
MALQKLNLMRKANDMNDEQLNENGSTHDKE